MEAFSLLKYWRPTTTNAGHATTNADVTTSTATTTTIVSTVTSQPSETGDEEDDEHGPFFDLQFSLPEEDEEAAENNYCEEEEEEDEEDSDGSSGESTENVNVSVSPSDELFFNNGFVPVEQTEKKIRSKSLSMQSRASLTKFRVMMLKFKNSKLNSKTEATENTESNADNCSNYSNSKEEQKEKEKEIEHVPHDSLFKRRNSTKAQNKQQNDDASVSSCSEEKKFTKEAMQRYLKKVKPLYVRVSKRYGDRLNLRPLTSQSLTASFKRENEFNTEVVEPPLLNSKVKELKQGNLPAGLRVVCKQLRKSRSAFTAVAAAPPGAVSSNRRDDSLLQQQDGIQSAILHCKRSFKASRDSDSSSSSGGDLALPDGKSLSFDEEEKQKEKETEEINKR